MLMGDDAGTVWVLAGVLTGITCFCCGFFALGSLGYYFSSKLKEHLGV